MVDEILTAEEVAKLLKISKQTMWNWCKKGRVPAYKMPGSRKWLINSKDLEKLQKELRSKKI